MKFEGQVERMEKADVVLALLTSPEDLSPLRRFLESREAECKNGMDNLLLTVDLIDIYLGAQCYHAAHETLDAAYEQAEGEGAEVVLAHLDAVKEQLLRR